MPANLRRLAAAAVALPLAAFFAFVGWSKATAPLADLARYHAWTVYIPEPVGRLVGWSEVAGAALLVLAVAFARFAWLGRIVAYGFIANQAVAAAVHAANGESGALPQNAVLAAAFALLAYLLPPSPTIPASA